MSIDVGNILSKSTPATKESPSCSGKHATGPAPLARQDADSVRLTDTANQLRQAERAWPAEAPMDAARITEIARAIERGEYPIDAARLAEKFLQLERELAG